MTFPILLHESNRWDMRRILDFKANYLRLIYSLNAFKWYFVLDNFLGDHRLGFNNIFPLIYSLFAETSQHFCCILGILHDSSIFQIYPYVRRLLRFFYRHKFWDDRIADRKIHLVFEVSFFTGTEVSGLPNSK